MNERMNEWQKKYFQRKVLTFVRDKNSNFLSSAQLILRSSPHPSPEKGHTSKSGFIIFTKATFWTNSNWFRIWGWLIQNYPKLFRYLHKCRILCFFQWSPLCILAEIQMADCLNLVSHFTLFYSILLSRIRRLCKYLKSFG